MAKTFENQIDDRSQWHSVLLRRMTLDIEGVRPHLLSSDAYSGFGMYSAMLIRFPSILNGLAWWLVRPNGYKGSIHLNWKNLKDF